MTRDYIEQWVRNKPLQNAVREAAYPPIFARCYRHILLPRPVFVSDHEIRGFADELGTIFALLTSLPQRLFGGDLERYCAAAGIDERLAALMIRGASGSPPLFLRSDAYYDGSSFRLLELNSGTELGGVDFAEMNRALLDVPAFKKFAAENELEYVDTADVIVQVLRDVARPVTSGDSPVVVLLETTGGIAAHPNFRAVAEAMTARGIDFRLGEVQQLRIRRGKLALDGTPIDVAMRFFAAGEILECPAGPSVLDPILRAHDEGKTILFTTLENSLFGSKGGLALLSDPRYRSCFDEAERRVIDKVVPWTRLLSDDDRLLDHCLANRERLIVKPCVGWGAAGAVLGSSMPDSQWRSALTSRAGTGYVAQEVVTPVPEPVCDPETGEVENWHANWGAFLTPAGYSGTFVRALKPADGRLITFANRGTRGTCVFSYPAHAAQAGGTARE